jgi:hypothetical protein
MPVASHTKEGPLAPSTPPAGARTPFPHTAAASATTCHHRRRYFEHQESAVFVVLWVSNPRPWVIYSATMAALSAVIGGYRPSPPTVRKFFARSAPSTAPFRHLDIQIRSRPPSKKTLPLCAMVAPTTNLSTGRPLAKPPNPPTPQIVCFTQPKETINRRRTFIDC